MICARCADAADRRAPANQHCDSGGGPGTACDCQHQTDRYHQQPTENGTLTVEPAPVTSLP